MCGRYAASWTKKHFQEQFGLEAADFTSYNIAPTQYSPIIWQQNGQNEVVATRWGLMPHWVKNHKNFKANLFNARAESLTQKASFKQPFKTKRCIIPATGFYEWKQTKNGKIPHFIHASNGETLAFAGLYDHWQSNAGELYSHTIITTEPNPTIQPLHQRMPVILNKEHFDLWLDPALNDTDALEQLLKPWEGDLAAYPITKRVGKPSENDKGLLEPAWVES